MGSLRDMFRSRKSPRNKKSKRKAVEVLFKSLERLLTLDVYQRKPGSIIESLPKGDREALEHLTSDELNQYRAEKDEMTDPLSRKRGGREELKELLHKFGKKMKVK